MTYKFISNEPFQRNNITNPFIFRENIFSEKEIELINKDFEERQLQDGLTQGFENEEELFKIRKSKVCFINKTPINSWMFQKFNMAINEINEYYYNFDLNGYENIQYTRYDSDVNGMYEWHMDTSLGKAPEQNNQTRKLSVIMLLNEPGKDFAGGDFELNIGSHSNPLKIDMKKGRIIAFPSFLIHRVKPVLAGVRKSLVIWVQGPKFK